MIPRLGPVAIAVFVASFLSVGTGAAIVPGTGPHAPPPISSTGSATSAVGNFSAAVNRLVDLLAVAGGGILALVWARVAFSWFSNDITKKVQAKDRARDALIGTLVFTAAITGLVWGLAQWVITGV
ncbi:MAG: hypothetical protein WAN74_08240 [Thermoplasmata archaeon]